MDPGLLTQAWVLDSPPTAARDGLATFDGSWRTSDFVLGPALACYACSQVMVVGPRLRLGLV